MLAQRQRRSKELLRLKFDTCSSVDVVESPPSPVVVFSGRAFTSRPGVRNISSIVARSTSSPEQDFPRQLNVPGLMNSAEYRATYAAVMRTSAEKLVSWMDELLRPRVLNRPALSVVLGSGLGGLVKQVDVLGELSFAKIGLPNTSADGHAGTFVLGLLGERPVLLQSGRLHLYENWHAAVVALPVRIQALAGIRTFVLTNAAGSLDVSVSVGDIVVLTGDRGAQAHSPSGGLYDDAQFDGPFGPKFFPVNEAYDCTLRAKFVEHARKLSHPVHQGVYQFMLGPRYEQINEILEFARLRQQAISAGDVDHALITVGMSTAPEVCALAQLRSDQRFSSIRTLAISNVTNLAAGVAGSVPSSEEVLSAGPFGGARIIEVLRAMIPEL